MRTVIFKSCFKDDMQSFMEYRVATFAWNTYRLDNYRLSSFDRYLTKISYNDEIVPQTIINQWLNDVGVPEASINGYIKTIRNFMKYRADMGKVVYLPPFQKTKDLYIPYIFSDEELSNIFAIADAYPMTNKFSSIPHIHMEMAVLIRLLYCCGLRLGDDDDKIRLNQRKPSKYKGLRRFGPEKNLQRINKFMKERPIFYKNLIQMKENFRFYLRCFYCITKVVILQFNSEKQDRISS